MVAPRKNARVAALAALLAGAAAMAIAWLSGGAAGHRVFVVAPDAANLVDGQQVRAAGQRVGEVESVEAIGGGRAARLALRIDDRAWPLRRGTTMRVRWGGTIAIGNRYLELRPGPDSSPPIPDGGTIRGSDFEAPVEFDELLRTFPAAVRRDLRAMLDAGGSAFRAAERPLRRSLGSAPPAVRQASAALEDLESESAALDTVVRSTDRVVDAARRADPGIGRLVSGASTTFAATAERAASLRSLLSEAPSTLDSTRATLANARETLRAAGDLADRLAPGVGEVRRLARPLASALGSVVRVGPDARATLATARRATPSLNPLLARLTELAPRIGSIGRQGAEQLHCIRPYSPDIAAWGSTWGDALRNSDGRDLFGRLGVTIPPFGNAETRSSAEIAEANPELTYSYPWPPGLAANQPWFLPECGIGREVLDPTKDPEARSFDPLSRAPAPGRDQDQEARR